MNGVSVMTRVYEEQNGQPSASGQGWRLAVHHFIHAAETEMARGVTSLGVASAQVLV